MNPNMPILSIFGPVLLAVLIFMTANYYSIWKTYESNALNGFLKCDIFWNYELDKSDDPDKEAGVLLRSANYWRWLYNTNLVYVRDLFTLVCFLFLTFILGFSITPVIFWISTLGIPLFLYFHAYRKAKKIRDSGENGYIYLTEDEKDFWIYKPQRKYLERKLKPKNEEDRTNIKQKIVKPLYPILYERLDELKKILEKENLEKGHCLNWFHENKNKKYHY
jgi:hypothetical protein